MHTLHTRHLQQEIANDIAVMKSAMQQKLGRTLVPLYR